MKRPENLKLYKEQLRSQLKKRRSEMSLAQKKAASQKIAARLQRLPAYQKAKTLLIYVSTEIEVDTLPLIQKALEQNKRVAVPRCVPGTREMEFYLIDSLDELTPGTFHVLEPAPNPLKRLTDWKDSLCVVPALGCDKKGYRIGYGGGYYDRFLNAYTGEKIAVLYKKGLIDHLWHGRYDIPVDRIVTEWFIIRTSKREKIPLFTGEGGRNRH